MESRCRSLPLAVTACTLAAALLFVLMASHGLELLHSGLDRGDSLTYLRSGWTCAIDDGEQFATELPALLPLPKNTQEITLSSHLPDTLRNGDVLRLGRVHAQSRACGRTNVGSRYERPI